jgi:hypothetical protein
LDDTFYTIADASTALGMTYRNAQKGPLTPIVTYTESQSLPPVFSTEGIPQGGRSGEICYRMKRIFRSQIPPLRVHKGRSGRKDNRGDKDASVEMTCGGLVHRLARNDSGDDGASVEMTCGGSLHRLARNDSGDDITSVEMTGTIEFGGASPALHLLRESLPSFTA